ncbi:hypothetical protein BN946_scf184770.g2 [Trametes cinnabarina]|uniref:C3H1-type domain-containing protein n=1 Tax=Pycnoporus cinnabarinus TaxID=5643 RepID=A0A060T0Z7_PYCCI|nr:hypothetical protein BN946_scf184770.g2 [Trametes cinnabarina]
MKSTNVANVSPDNALYVEQRELRRLQRGQVDSPNHSTLKAAAAFTKVGKGRLGYVGDVNGEIPTTAVVIAMCFHTSSRPPVAPGTGVPDQTTRNLSSPADDQKPSILIISFQELSDRDHYAQLYRAIRQHASVTQVWDRRATLRALSLSSPSFSGVLVTDGAIAEPEHSELASRLAECTRAGTRVVLGVDVGCFISPSNMPALFSKWGLRWDRGDYGRTNLTLNPAGLPSPLREAALFPSVSAKALHVKNVRREHAVYVPGPDGWGSGADESPAVFARVGNGYLGYVGDVNGEQQLIRLLIEMLGITIKPGDMGPRMVTESVSYSGGVQTDRRVAVEEEIPLPPQRRARAAEVQTRAAHRARMRQQKKARADRLKEEGNMSFRDQNWLQAAEKYKAAALITGPDPLYLSNLAAALLKLKLWEAADSAASCALLQDPGNVKALYRRAVARKELSRFKAAEEDLMRLLLLDRSNLSARSELDVVRRMKHTERNFDWPGDEDLSDVLSPLYDGPIALEEESDSEDYQHAGNGTPCKSYNHHGCSKGKGCRFRHAPDWKSVRDNLGRNVCIYWLLGTCRYGDERCIYAHDDTYLPKAGWWTNTRRLDRLRQQFSDAVEKSPRHGLTEHILAESLKPMDWRKDVWAFQDYAEAAEIQRQFEELDETDSFVIAQTMADDLRYVANIGGLTAVASYAAEQESQDEEVEYVGYMEEVEPW